jgi:GDPmannose 4,6-dehydratase
VTAKTALITGVTGQDGAYLAQLLIDKGYKVIGTSRDAQINTFPLLNYLGIESEVEKVSMSLTDFRSVITVLSIHKPDEIYHLAGQSSVSLSFSQPAATIESIIQGSLNLTEAVRFLGHEAKVYNASSSEMFGNTPDGNACESTPLNPCSPYGVAKASSFMQFAFYRKAYGMFLSSGILFNHESPLRPVRFVTKKIVRAACDIHRGINTKLKLGNLNVVRDWGWAPDYVEAMYLILQHEDPTDFVIATGKGHSLMDFLEITFGLLDLKWRDYVTIDNSLFRPLDLERSVGRPEKAKICLGWSSKTNLLQIIQQMIDFELSLNS